MIPDLILVGGGLANCLIAYRLHCERPDLRVLLIEQGSQLGGNHTWSFHGSDLSVSQRAWLRPLIGSSWPRHEIIFPARHRALEGSYHSIYSEQLHRRICSRLGESVMTSATVAELRPDGVTLADGRRIAAAAVIDGRGSLGDRSLDVRFQKFLGLVVQLAKPSGLEAPILMDATVEQIDGFRFMYTLPLEPTCLLIEDTRYSDTPILDEEGMRAAIRDYAKSRGWEIVDVLREEVGALPVVLGGDLEAFWKDAPDVPRAGVRAGLFHFTTSYSLPEAVRLADVLAVRRRLTSAVIAPLVRARSFRLWRQGRYYRILNRMLFLAGPPEERYRILEHFYRLPLDLVNRFYAGRLRMADKLRILSGRPPVSVTQAVASLIAPLRDTESPPQRGDSS